MNQLLDNSDATVLHMLPSVRTLYWSLKSFSFWRVPLCSSLQIVCRWLQWTHQTHWVGDPTGFVWNKTPVLRVSKRIFFHLGLAKFDQSPSMFKYLFGPVSKAFANWTIYRLNATNRNSDQLVFYRIGKLEMLRENVMLCNFGCAVWKRPGSHTLLCFQFPSQSGWAKNRCLLW